MKTVLLMRHAKSSWSDTSLADHDRPLNARGRAAAPRMGEHLNGVDLIPDVILCSTAKRAKLTVEYLLRTCQFDGETIYSRDLYHGSIEDYLKMLQALDDKNQTALVVGHNPDMEYFLETFSGGWERMPTAAIAHLVFEINNWAEIKNVEEAKLLNLWTPKGLG